MGALTSPEQGYSPPTIIEAGGVRQLSCPAGAVTSVDPETGKEYWSVPYEATNGSIIMSPVGRANSLYVGGYSNKSLLLKLAADEPAAEIVWATRRSRHLAGQRAAVTSTTASCTASIKRELYAVELPTANGSGKRTEPLASACRATARRSSSARATARWLFNDSGDLVIAQDHADGFEELDRAHVIEPTNDAFNRRVVWCLPAFANKRAYIRNDEECICVDLAK